MRLSKFSPSHIDGARANRHESEWQWLLEPARLVALDDTAAVSVFDGNDLLAIGGTIDIEDDVVVAWALFTDKAMPRHFPSLHRKAERGIAALFRGGLRRMVIYVDPGFEQAKRWAKLLKFTAYSTMEFQGRDLIVMERTA